MTLRDFDRADYHLAKSAELNPNDARILLRIGFYRSFLWDQRIDLRYDPRRPAPLETELSMEDRILVGGDGQTVVEFLLLPKEER